MWNYAREDEREREREFNNNATRGLNRYTAARNTCDTINSSLTSVAKQRKNMQRNIVGC